MSKEKGRWENRAHEFFKAEVGDEKFQQHLNDQFKDATEAHDKAGIFGSLQVKLKKTKIGRLFNKTSLVCEGEVARPHPVGGAGFITVVNTPQFPSHPFFRPGRVFRARMRHANLSKNDDASLDGRVTCLKFCDNYEGGPLDLILQTGRVPPYYNGTSFEEYLASFKDGERSLRTWALQKPVNYFGRVESMRRCPESYTDQIYYSNVLYQFIGEDGVRRLARIRLCPEDGRPETGLPGHMDQQFIWHTERDPEETRSPGYLRQEYRDRLRSGPIHYMLQIQLRFWLEDEAADILNPCVIWEEPWLDLATVTIILPLDTEEHLKTKHILTNQQTGFGIPTGPSMQCFSSLGLVISEFHGTLEPVQSDDRDLVTCTYVIEVTTGKVGNAGTDADVYISIVGTHGRTPPFQMDHFFHDDFELGQTDTFEMMAPPVGDLVLVELELRSITSGRDWFVDHVIITLPDQDRKWKFLGYKWLTSAQPWAFLRLGEALLSHEEQTPYGQIHRKFEVDERRTMYQWEKVDGLPSRFLVERFEDIPRESRFHREKEDDLNEKFLRTLTNTGYGTIKSILESWESLDDYKKYLTSALKDKAIVKKVTDCWRDDKEFGRQFLNGIHPMKIKQVTSIPVNFTLTKAMVQPHLDRGMTFDQELKDGLFYLVTYPELKNLKTVDKLKTKTRGYVACPMCLFYLNSEGDLLPVAIQLHQSPGHGNPVFTPADSETDWLFAKMWVKEADAQIHQVVSRHFYTHLVMEVMTVATMRNLPRIHPVFKLLIPHLRYTIVVNALGRKSLYPSEDGLFERYTAIGANYTDLLKDAYQDFKLEDLHLPKDLQKRGVCDATMLPGYYFRDDGLELWRIIKKFVRTMLFLHYWTPENVQKDEELQEWIRDIHDNGFPCYGGHDHGVPSKFTTLDEVIDFVTLLIFTASCQNAALTSGMLDYYAFLPNMPSMLMVPPPTVKGDVTMEDIMKALPGRTKTAEIIGVFYTLSRFSKDELFLGEYPEEYFCDEVACSAILAFQEDLKYLSATIKERNQNLTWPYTYLLPERIPNSIST